MRFENTLIYSFYMCQKSRLYVEDKIVFEANEDSTLRFYATVFTYFAL